ncbi:MAG: type II toxin-antitoxin system prevent-host-death family antitoxin [Desulfohalobiaceae bacterium]
MKTITASEANRRFSRVLREVAQGETYTAVSRGKPVASIGPTEGEASRRRRAKAELLKRLHSQAVTGDRDWTREELYRNRMRAALDTSIPAYAEGVGDKIDSC